MRDFSGSWIIDAVCDAALGLRSLPHPPTPMMRHRGITPSASRWPTWTGIRSTISSRWRWRS